MNLIHKRILAVDDNRVNLKIIRSYLESAGADVVEVTSGVRALETLLDAQQTGNPFSMAIIDVEMPIMDGIMLVRAIRSQESMRDLPIALLSSSAHNVQLPIITELHIRSVMNKPVHRDALLEAVERTLSGKVRSGPAGFGALIRLKGGLRILLAEDNAVNQKVATLMLQRHGAAVYIVNNGVEAFKAIQNQPFDAILMDCQMPDMDGYEATRAIRSWEQQNGRPPIPIIALTANVLSDAKSNCIAAGMDGYLNKPLTMTELVDTLNRFTNPN